ncbi:hypothetical protein QJS66_19875 [Kocuria rhizophila]|nr:hypothetical protein QJS66_19875 [Kocuria rhizophila]
MQAKQAGERHEIAELSTAASAVTGLARRGDPCGQGRDRSTPITPHAPAATSPAWPPLDGSSSSRGSPSSA